MTQHIDFNPNGFFIDLDQEAFENWLRGQFSNDIVGTACNNDSCPIFTYLKTATDLPVTGVEGKSVYLDLIDYENGSLNKRYSVPDWVYTFVERVDSPRDIGESVTAGEALEILDNLDMEIESDGYDDDDYDDYEDNDYVEEEELDA